VPPVPRPDLSALQLRARALEYRAIAAQSVSSRMEASLLRLADRFYLHQLGAVTTYTVQGTDAGLNITSSGSSANAVTLSSAGSAGFQLGVGFGYLNLGPGAVTETPSISKINGNSSQILHQYGGDFPVSDGSNWYALGFPGFGTITTNALSKYIDASGATTASNHSDNGTTISTSETISASALTMTTSTTPADNAACMAGQLWWDSGFLYLCVASGTVKRAALSTY
jgi:hypothetical protein